MEGSVDDRRPFVDPAVLEILRRELEPDSEYCVVFVNNYIQQLPLRLDRLRQAVETMDLGSAMDAVLSVKTSSQMVGTAYLWRVLPQPDGRACRNQRLAGASR